MLVHVMGINLCQYLDDWLIYSPSHDQCLRDTVQVLNLCLLIHDKKLELIPKQKFLFLGYQFDLVSFQVTPTLDRYHKSKALIRSFLLSQGGCAHTWQILLGLFASTEKNGSSGKAAHPRSPTLHLSTLGFQCFNQNLWILLSPTAEEDFQWWKSAHNVLRGAPVTMTEPDAQIVHGFIEHRLGSTLECIDGVRCMDNNRENTSHQRTQVRSHTQSHAPLAAEDYGSDNPGCVSSVLHQQATVVSYINKQGGTRSIQRYRQTKKLLLMCQANQIVLRAWHIPGRLNVLADILSRPSQMSGTKWSLHPSVFWMGNPIIGSVCN